MPQGSVISKIADGATILMCLIALGLGWRLISGQTEDSDRDVRVAEWSKWVEGGRLVGSAVAPVQIVEFVDYECPFCRRFEGTLEEVRERFGDQIAVVYRHFPLSYHEHAYEAARMAECAASVGRFQEVHSALIMADLASFLPQDAAELMDVEDRDRFLDCTTDDAAVAAIERDLELGRELGVASTPTIAINGVELARVPTLEQLVLRVDSILAVEQGAGGERNE